MKNYQSILITTLTASTVILVGCTAVTTTNTNGTNTTTVNATNAVITANTTNENINTADVDTSDWLTYENEEYGFSFRYPQDLQLEVRKEDQLFRVYAINETLPFDYDFMAFSFSPLSGRSSEKWFDEEVDINNVLTPYISETKNGYKSLAPRGGDGIEDLNGYAQIVSFVEDEINDRIIAFFGGQDFSVLESLGHDHSQVISDIIDSMQFEKVNL